MGISTTTSHAKVLRQKSKLRIASAGISRCGGFFARHREHKHTYNSSPRNEGHQSVRIWKNSYGAFREALSTAPEKLLESQ